MTVCLNENILEKILWEEFKHIIIKYLTKYFTTNDNDDTFCYVQFDINGLITKSFFALALNQFIIKFNKIKNNNIELTDYAFKNEAKNLIGIYSIFDTIINCYQK